MQGRLLFLLAILAGSYSYILFFSGLSGMLNKTHVSLVTFSVFIILAFSIATNLESLKNIFIQAKNYLFYFSILAFFAVINLVGVLGPELGFDALWYHLVLPKLYIESESIRFFPGGLLYYSVMPKLIDLLYIPALMFSSEIAAKFVHFIFGILTVIVTYKIANLFVDRKLSCLAALIFYSNLVVGWLSITAYIDLGRAFFSSLAVYFILLYFKEKSTRFLLFSSMMVGFEISSKLLGFSTLISILISILIFSSSQNYINRLKNLFQYLALPSVIILPWIIFSYSNTSTIFYPFFTEIYPSGFSIESINPFLVIKNTVSLFLFSADPISPIYLITLPFIVVLFRKSSSEMRALVLIVLINIIIWNFIPQKNSRFIVPYLPLMSALTVWVISKLKFKPKVILLAIVYLTFTVNLVYRGVANFKYIPVISGAQSKDDFLVENLNFQFGDYYDLGGNVKRIVGDEEVLIVGIHNLYYIDFNYVHESWAEDKEFKYILTNEPLVKTGYNLVYKNLVNSTYLYEISR